MTEKKYKCDHCGSQFFGFRIDPSDMWDFQDIAKLEGVDWICKGCIYEILYKHYREKVWKMKDCIENW